MDKNFEESFKKELERAFSDIQGSTAYSMDKDRLYDGQPQTEKGERGKTLIKGLTMRDVADCIVKAFLACGGIERERPIYDDVYKINLEDIDPIAVIKDTMCNVEKMMGIFPNVPKLKWNDKNNKEI